MNRDLKVGDRVLFDPRVSRYSHVPCNPVGVIGIVEEIDACISVLWSNGDWNVYQLNDEDLVYYGEEE